MAPQTAASGNPFDEDRRHGRAQRWQLAGLVVLLAHATAAYALMTRMPEAPPQGAEQAPVLIDLAPPAQSSPSEAIEDAAPAQQTVDTNEPAPRGATTEPSPAEAEQPEANPEPAPAPDTAKPEPAAPPPASEPPPPQPQPPQPTPAPAEPQPQTEPEPATPPIPDAVPLPQPSPEPQPDATASPTASETVALPDAVPLPTARPQPPKPPRQAVRETPKAAPPPSRRKAPQRQDNRARQRQTATDSVAARGQSRNQASQGASVSRAEIAGWQSQVQARLNSASRRFSGRGAGTTRIAFAMDGNGRVIRVSVVASSGNPSLDAMAVELVRRASPFPAPPSGRDVSLTVPVRLR
ncbi:TonB family protein [Jiella sp. MQZ9-1]|uniref:TonB family protein n=1 Tax=Jiella flava TaxID=2816857 RepID=A0A939JR70_9HYPH|nr:TonB family protein [Jiella flava]MBO0661608.1 TonB family protein [Jiella flava]MCD2470250.1 TonB family protein [Jiella flava]